MREKQKRPHFRDVAEGGFDPFVLLLYTTCKKEAHETLQSLLRTTHPLSHLLSGPCRDTPAIGRRRTDLRHPRLQDRPRRRPGRRKGHDRHPRRAHRVSRACRQGQSPRGRGDRRSRRAHRLSRLDLRVFEPLPGTAGEGRRSSVSLCRTTPSSSPTAARRQVPAGAGASRSRPAQAQKGHGRRLPQGRLHDGALRADTRHLRGAERRAQPQRRAPAADGPPQRRRPAHQLHDRTGRLSRRA